MALQRPAKTGFYATANIAFRPLYEDQCLQYKLCFRQRSTAHRSDEGRIPIAHKSAACGAKALCVSHDVFKLDTDVFAGMTSRLSDTT